MSAYEVVNISRDCDAVQIPSGIKVTIPKGTEVKITQSLGGKYTVITDQGFMVSVDGVNADALGKKSETAPAKDQPSQSQEAVDISKEAVEKKVWENLKTCFDPEIPVNIVDLGLIYECKVEPTEGGHVVNIKMTLTAPGCGMGETIKQDAEAKIASNPGVKQTHIELVWQPTWNPSMMSEAAKLQLGMM